MIKVGITGQSGFVGTHLHNVMGLMKDEFERVPFEDAFFKDDKQLRVFVRNCDVIVHLAAMNRHIDDGVIYETNMQLVKQLISAMEAEEVAPHVLFSSSTQEELDKGYGKSKREGRILFEKWAERSKGGFSGLVVPNVYGPFGKPDYNSFIGTFCYKLTHGEEPEIIEDNSVRLIYIWKLCSYIVKKIRLVKGVLQGVIEKDFVPFDLERKVSDILSQLKSFKDMYFDQGIIPELNDINDVNLFNTYRSYIDYENHFPVKLQKYADNRGIFVETLRLGVGGQVSFSTTVPEAIRGNHFHTRKVERFTVIKGKARIQLRRIGTDKVIDFYLDGKEPGYVDIPVWYTHNITNIGEEDLYTQFWINEWFNPKDGDTYFETV